MRSQVAATSAAPLFTCDLMFEGENLAELLEQLHAEQGKCSPLCLFPGQLPSLSPASSHRI